MTQRPLVVVQRRPTQIDSPLFQRLAALGVDLTVRYAQLEQPIDPELGVRPDFGDRLLEGYRWSVGVGRFPPSAHVMVAGWASGFAWQSIVRRIGSGRTLGIRFGTVARRQQAGLLRWSAWLRQTVALRAADVWHPVGHASERYASKVVRNGRPVVPVPYAIDTAPFQGEASVKPNRNITVIAVSKLNEREGVRDLIVAASRMKGVRLRIVGDGPLRLELAELATQLRVDAKFIGYVPFAQLPAEYAVADVFAHPAYAEPWGVSVQEAMASGLPIVASSAVGSAHELLPMNQSAWCHAPGDTETLGSLIDSLRDPELRLIHARANFDSARKFSVDSTARALLQYLQS